MYMQTQTATDSLIKSGLFSNNQLNPLTKQKIIFVMGGPGSGKGTHCKLLEKEFNYHHISTGDLIRDIIKNGNGYDDKIRESINAIVSKGELINDQMIIDLVYAEMRRHPFAAGFLIDGCPRTVNQIELFEKSIRPCDLILNFELSSDEMIKRMLGRSSMEHRADDNEKTILHRIDVFKEQTVPAINKLHDRYTSQFIAVNTEREIDVVKKDIHNAIIKLTVPADLASSAQSNKENYMSAARLFSTTNQEPVEKRTLTLGNVTQTFPLSKIPTMDGYFIYLKLNDSPALVNEGARLMAERIKSLNLANPYFVTAEASTIAMAHVLRDKYKINGTILYKSRQIDDVDPVSTKYKSVTSTDVKQLFLGLNKAAALLDKDIVIIDSICTTGGTLKAMYNLLIKAGLNPDRIKEATMLFSEGRPLHQLDMGNGKILPIHYFGELQIYQIPESNKSLMKKP